VLATFAAAFALGIVFNAVPGVVFAQTVRIGARGGFKPALAVQIGSLVGDALWAILGLLGVGLLLQVQALRLPVGIAGAIYLCWLAWHAWRAANEQFSVGTAPGFGIKRALRSGMLLSITNPNNIAYWAALGSARQRSRSGWHPRSAARGLRDILRRLYGVLGALVFFLRRNGRSDIPPRRSALGARHLSCLRGRVPGARGRVGSRSFEN
jgi:threonine/homoserine/homoserine lactone efflux protein